jgi:hypothetical protein
MGFLFLADWPKISSVKPVHVYKEMPALGANDHKIDDRVIVRAGVRQVIVSNEKNLWGILDMRHRNSHQRESQFLAPE